MKRRADRQLFVRALSSLATRGFVSLGPLRLPCALGRSGVRAMKREGDGATPMGRWRVREVMYRSDRLLRPSTRAPLRPLARDDGWCDAPTDRNYNRRVCHPYAASAEQLWRADSLYDVVVVLGYNDGARVRGRGSAIFMHVARDGYRPTEGCIALARSDLLRVIARLRAGDVVVVG
jgi:L,D-peptidoglycan transpeptidase YkuD (ErfK/YbiS/YcfS/YnhG family)